MGSYAPPMIMSNEDISRVVDTNDEWIYSRSGIKRGIIPTFPLAKWHG